MPVYICIPVSAFYLEFCLALNETEQDRPSIEMTLMTVRRQALLMQ